jgi:DNA mismatch repair protein MutL
MGRIRQLDEQTANGIAAGEVVERPASVVKELCENAIDAEASVLSIEIRGGGIQEISVTDDGVGMDPDDALAAFGRHATSKIATLEDLDRIGTLGFRGEALASIASVARVALTTRRIGAESGTVVRIEGGKVLQTGPAGGPEGTRIVVSNLFYNVPARYKFLKKDATEASQIADVVGRMALARPGVSFRFVSNGAEVLRTPGNNDLKSAIFAVYGREAADGLVPVQGGDDAVKVAGYVGLPAFPRKSRAAQTLFVNGRLVRSRAVSSALDRAYETLLMKDRYAFAVLSLTLPPSLVDVNVHPQKMEVRFWNEGAVFSAVHAAVRDALRAGFSIPEAPQQGREEAYASEDRAAQTPAVHSPVYEQVPISPLTLREAAASPGSDRSSVGPPVPTAPHSAPERPFQPASGPGGTYSAEVPSDDRPVSPPRVSDLAAARLIGTLFDTYLLLQLDDDLLLIDQHAAHERILYERLVARVERRESASQPLLVPLVVEMGPAAQSAALASADALHGLGFDFDAFGPHSVALRAVPVPYRALDPKAAFLAAVDGLEHVSPQDPESIREMLHTVACKAAVKAHDVLDASEAEALLADLRAIENPYTCPHGRPVVIRMPRRELEKRFKRIV